MLAQQLPGEEAGSPSPADCSLLAVMSVPFHCVGNIVEKASFFTQQPIF